MDNQDTIDAIPDYRWTPVNADQSYDSGITPDLSSLYVTDRLFNIDVLSTADTLSPQRFEYR